MRNRRRHGGPYDRGAADSWYRRPFAPHYYVGASNSTRRVPKEEMTPKEIAEYTAGFDDNQAAGEFKNYGS